MPPRNRPATAETADVEATTTPDLEELGELEIEDAEWTGSGGRQIHPQLQERIQRSWDNRVVNGNHIQTPAFKVPVRNADELKLRTRQLRDAAAALKIGVGIRPEVNDDGAGYVHFRARKRRGSGDVSA